MYMQWFVIDFAPESQADGVDLVLKINEVVVSKTKFRRKNMDFADRLYE